jgi:hypothetical protein
MRPGEVDFTDAVGKLHTEVFGKVANTPWYGDAVYDRFSDAEYQRRFDATQQKMRRPHRLRWAQSLELGRWDALAEQPLGMAWDVGLRGRPTRR